MQCLNYFQLQSDTSLLTFAENQICGPITEPANAFSNIIFIVIAVLIFRHPSCVKNSFIGYSLVFSSLFIGASSFFLHATSSYLGNFVDRASILYLMCTVLLCGLSKRYRLENYLTLCCTIVVWLLLSLCMWLLPSIGLITIGLVIVVYLIREYQDKSLQHGHLTQALAIFILGWIAWWLDIKKVWDIDSIEHIFNGHVLWHICSAIAIYFLFLHHTQENQNLSKGNALEK
jgi:4-amino-4-deoxy-L-arabinose transferase-like glycosyltransferase